MTGFVLSTESQLCSVHMTLVVGFWSVVLFFFLYVPAYLMPVRSGKYLQMAPAAPKYFIISLPSGKEELEFNVEVQSFFTGSAASSAART